MAKAASRTFRPASFLGYPGVGGEQRELQVPPLLAVNGTFLVFAELDQDVTAFRTYLDSQCRP